jgi:predicted GH43/DUF377 family glycosyl hydrolase
MGQNSEINWIRDQDNPITSLAPQPGTWREYATMTADILVDEANHQFLAYFNGKVEGVNRFGLATSPVDKFDGKNWTEYPGNPVIEPGPARYDNRHTIDPAVVRFKGKVFLYYSALGDGVDSIGLATSDDGYHFSKHPEPILVGRAPEVVLLNDTLYLFYVLENEKGGYVYHLGTSTDGISFKEEGVVFSPSLTGWDCVSLLTARIYKEKDIFILAYAGDDVELDRPKYFGFAFSTDLRNWTKYSKNPVFEVDPSIPWEGKGIWFPEIIHSGDTYYMLYEGNDGKRSQIGLATSKDPIADIGRRELGLE